jgi:glycosyltransferase involved in cell wall biosynthesis
VKIVHVITTLDVGGAEKHLLWLGTAQVQRGHDVSVLYLKGDGSLSGAFTDAGMGVGKVPFEGGGQLLSAVSGLRRQILEREPDVVHTHLLKADALGALAVPRHTPLVASKHNDERALLRTSVGLAHGLLSRRADRIIALSDHVARFVAEHGRVAAERIRRVYYGVDAETLQPSRPRADLRADLGLGEDVPLLVCVGRIAPQKDHPTLLAAMALLPPEVVLLVVGGDPFGDALERLGEQVREQGLEGRVRLLGIRHDVPDLLGAADLFVLPSLWEGLGLVFLEAMAARLPVVASNVSAIPEVVEDGVSGWLVPPGEPGLLAEALSDGLAHPDDRLARGVAGHMRLLERFALPRMVDETLEVYDEARTARGTGP